MKKYKYKYFSKIEHAKCFLKGDVYFQNLAFFRDYEDKQAKQIIGDEFEGIRIFRPEQGLQINTQHSSSLIDMGFEAECKSHEIFIFCVSHTFSETLINDFSAKACIRIKNSREFINRWEKSLPEEASHLCKRVTYYDKELGPGNSYLLPENIATEKISEFKYQDEYRFVFSKTDALEFGKTQLTLKDRISRPSPDNTKHDNITLNLGDLSDICELVEIDN